NEKKKVPLDGGIAFFGFQATGYEKKDATDGRGGDDLHIENGGGSNHAYDCGQDQRHFFSGVLSREVRLVEEQNILVGTQVLHRLFGAHHEKRVAEFQTERVELFANIHPSPVDGQNRHAESLAEIQFADRLP